LLLLRRKPVFGVQIEVGLISVLALFLARLGDRRDQLGLAAAVARRLVERLALGIEGWCREGSAYGELSIGCSKKGLDCCVMVAPSARRGLPS